MNGLNELLDGLMLTERHVRLYNEVKPAENQPLDLSVDYKENMNFINLIKPKDRGKSIYNGKAIIKVLKEDSRVIDVVPKSLRRFCLILALSKSQDLLMGLIWLQRINSLR
jgi:lipoprotein-releasing system permease protein